jgi:sulfur carrier protein ThiS
MCALCSGVERHVPGVTCTRSDLGTAAVGPSMAAVEGPGGRVMRRLVLGIGTGRTGSLALATLLNRQPGVSMHHELRQLSDDGRLGVRTIDPLPWERDLDHAKRAIDVLSRRPGHTGGDVGSYWLPYVEAVLDELHPDTRVVALSRDREAVIQSYLRKVPNKNHWMVHDGTEWELAPKWDVCFPKYEVGTKEAALAAYWDEYYGTVEQLTQTHPDRVRVWDLDVALNTPLGVNELLEFVGIAAPQRLVAVGVNRNRSSRSLTQYARVWGRRLRRG